MESEERERDGKCTKCVGKKTPNKPPHCYCHTLLCMGVKNNKKFSSEELKFCFIIFKYFPLLFLNNSHLQGTLSSHRSQGT